MFYGADGAPDKVGVLGVLISVPSQVMHILHHNHRSHVGSMTANPFSLRQGQGGCWKHSSSNTRRAGVQHLHGHCSSYMLSAGSTCSVQQLHPQCFSTCPLRRFHASPCDYATFAVCAGVPGHERLSSGTVECKSLLDRCGAGPWSGDRKAGPMA
jgi:hypothetical protein